MLGWLRPAMLGLLPGLATTPRGGHAVRSGLHVSMKLLEAYTPRDFPEEWPYSDEVSRAQSRAHLAFFWCYARSLAVSRSSFTSHSPA